jgi:hypothetical protein
MGTGQELRARNMTFLLGQEYDSSSKKERRRRRAFVLASATQPVSVTQTWLAASHVDPPRRKISSKSPEAVTYADAHDNHQLR